MNESLFQVHRYKRYFKNVEPIFKTTKVQAYFMVILTLFTLSFFGISAIRPTLKTIASLQRKIDDSSQVNAKLEEKINNLIAAQEEYQRIEPDLPLIYSLLPEKPEFPSLLRKIENLTIENEATISGIQFDPIILYGTSTTVTEKSNTTGTMSTPLFFSLTFIGTYPNLLKLLEYITSLDRLITIDSVDLTLNNEEGTISTLNIAILSRAYYYQLTL